MDKQALLAALAPVRTAVAVEGFGDVQVKQLTVAEADAVRGSLKADEQQPSEFGLKLLVASVIDDTGAAVFTADDLTALQSAASSKVDVLMKAVLKANGFDKSAGDAAGN